MANAPLVQAVLGAGGLKFAGEWQQRQLLRINRKAPLRCNVSGSRWAAPPTRPIPLASGRHGAGRLLLLARAGRRWGSESVGEWVGDDVSLFPLITSNAVDFIVFECGAIACTS